MRLYAKKSIELKIEELEKSIMHPKKRTVAEAIVRIIQLRREIAVANRRGERLTKEIEKIRINNRE